LIHKTMKPEESPTYQRYAKLMTWVDKYRQLKVRTNADEPKQAAEAVAFGAEGIGLCRTEHMFREGDRLDIVRGAILVASVATRAKAKAAAGGKDVHVMGGADVIRQALAAGLVDELTIIAGQRAQVRRATKSIASFKLREGMAVGARVTLRGARMYEFLDRLASIALPRIRDFRGLDPGSFDGRGNYSIGIREQIIFPEIDYDKVPAIRGLDVAITTSAKTDEAGRALLGALGLPFATERRER